MSDAQAIPLGKRPGRAPRLDPEIQAFLGQLDELGLAVPSPLEIGALRIHQRKWHELTNPSPRTMARQWTELIDGIPCQVYVPQETSERLGVLLYLHGGGCCTLDPVSYAGLTTAIADRARCIAVVPDYRLAPEHPFPAALDDCFSTLRWLQVDAPKIGGDPDRIVIAGDSAGGYLATAVCLEAKRRGVPQPLRQLLAYPNTDLRPMNGSDPALLEAEAVTNWQMALYAGPNADDPRVSPLLAPDLAGLAPATIISAEHDPLNPQVAAYVQALRGAGVSVVHTTYHGTIHGFVSMAAVSSAARLAVVHMAAIVRLVTDGGITS